MKLVVQRLGGLVVSVSLGALVAAGCSGAASKGSGDGGGPGGETPVAPPGACSLPTGSLPPRRIIRLSPLQYSNALKANFNHTFEASALPPDPLAGGGFAVFDTNFAEKQVTPEHFNVFRGAADAVAAATIKSLEANNGCVLNKPDDACVATFVADYGQRAFRRPLDDDEAGRYRTFFKTAEGKWGAKAAARMIVEAMLQSPRHLYRTELGGGDGEKVALTQYELANQLSFMLADQAPDSELLQAAKDGKLRDADEVKKHAQRLMSGGPARARMVSLFTQMYGVSEGLAANLAKDTAVYPDFSPTLRDAMTKETGTFIDAVLNEGGSLKTLYTADHSYLNKALATHYGASTSGLGNDFKKVSLPAGRRGLWGHASVLAVHSHKDGTSPALRGITLFTKLFCRPIPAAPPGAVDLANGKIFAPDKNFTQREHFEFAKQKAPECTSCHGHFVPLGLGLEQFDGVGKQRTTEFGKTLDTKVNLTGYGDDVDGGYEDTLQLIDKVVQSDIGTRCFATQAFSFAFGQDVDSDTLDSCEIKRLADGLKASDFSVADVMLNLTQIDSFYNRRQGS